ncbi:MAG TPA: hypothetical protein VNW95_07555 [Mucilaginibacter sp.]|jgi:hypothetical protein|nr:hypothetical protein [Mucilaginibacter sp.]
MRKGILICFNLILISSYFSFSQIVVIRGRIVSLNNSTKGVSNVKIALNTTDNKRQQTYSRVSGEFSMLTTIVKTGNYVTLELGFAKLPSKGKYLVPNLNELSFRVGDKNNIIIHVQLESDQKTQNKTFNHIALNNLTILSNQKIRYFDSLIGKTSDNNIVKSYKDSIASIRDNIKKSKLFVNNAIGVINSLPKQESLYKQIKNGNLLQAQQTLNKESESISGEIEKLNSSKLAFSKNVTDIYNKAILAKLLLDYPAATIMFKSVINAEPLNINYLFGYIDFLIFDNNKPQDAIRILKTISLNNLKTDNLKIHFYNSYGVALSDVNQSDSARYYFLEKIKLINTSKSLSYKDVMEGLATSYLNIATCYNGRDDSVALNYYQRANKTLDTLQAKSNWRDNSLASLLYRNIGATYINRGEKSAAFRNYSYSIKLLDKERYKNDDNFKNYLDIQRYFNNLQFQLTPTTATFNLGKSFLDTLNNLNKKYKNNLTKITINYSIDLADNSWTLKDSSSSIYYYRYAIDLLKPLLNDTDLSLNKAAASHYYQLANHYKMLGRQTECLKSLDTSKLLFIRFNNLIDLNFADSSNEYLINKADYFLNMAKLSAIIQDTTQQLRMIKKAYSLLNDHRSENNEIWTKKIEVNNQLRRFYFFSDHYKESFKADSESLIIYHNNLKNYFLNELPIARTTFLLGEDAYYLYHDSGSKYLKYSLGLMLEALASFKNSFANDSSSYAAEIGSMCYFISRIYQRLEDADKRLFYSKMSLHYYSLAPLVYLTDNDYYQIVVCDYHLGSARPLSKSINYLRSGYTLLLNSTKVKMSSRERLNFLSEYYTTFGAYFSESNESKSLDSANYYIDKALGILDTLYKKDANCIPCWIANRENLIFSHRVSDSEKFKIYQEDIDIIEHTLKLDSLDEYFGSNENILTATSNFLNLSSMYADSDKYDIAIRLLEKRLYILNKYPVMSHSDTAEYNLCYNNLAFSNIVIHKQKLAINYLKLCLEKYKDDKSKALNVENLAYAYLFNNNLKKAVKMLQDFSKTNYSDIPQLKKFIDDDYAFFSIHDFDKNLLEQFKTFLSHYPD